MRQSKTSVFVAFAAPGPINTNQPRALGREIVVEAHSLAKALKKAEAVTGATECIYMIRHAFHKANGGGDHHDGLR